MVQTERGVEERHVLETLARLEDAGQVATLQAIAIHSRLDMYIVHAIVNALFTSGDITPQLSLSDQGRRAIGG